MPSGADEDGECCSRCCRPLGGERWLCTLPVRLQVAACLTKSTPGTPGVHAVPIRSPLVPLKGLAGVLGEAGGDGGTQRRGEMCGSWGWT